MKLIELRLNEPDAIEKALPSSGAQAVSTYSGWLSLWPSMWRGIRESFPGAWQRNITLDSDSNILAFSAVFACVTGIASDIAKMRIKLSENKGGIWDEITEPAETSATWLSLLRKPNHYQTRIEFISQWIVSKLLYGNAYILKERDRRGVVRALYVLHPQRVTALVAPDGSVFYSVMRDDLAQVPTDRANGDAIPAREIIHDKMVCLWHPLVGVPPIYACGQSATMGNRIQSQSTKFFDNMSMPSVFLSAPGKISDESAKRLKQHFEENFSGDNIGKVAVGGDGLTLQTFMIPAEAAQLIDQLKWTVEDVARAFRYPNWKLGGPMPPYSSGPEAMMMMYYNDCLHPLIESLELCFDEGLELPRGIGVELDLDVLMRMDTKTLFETNNLGVNGGWLAPDEARFKANYRPVPGGKSPMIQQQNYSLAALAKRDAKEDPFGSPAPKPPEPPPAKPEAEVEKGIGVTAAVPAVCIPDVLNGTLMRMVAARPS